MPSFNITEEHLTDFDRDGYVIVEDLFDAEEMQLLRDIAKADREVAARVTDREDAAGGITSLALSNEVHDDIFGAIVRSRRMVNTVEKLLGDEVYHYHHKMMLKEPFVGGAWEWHQDYGYWYNNGCLFPDMASVMIAVDRANKENGCLQVIRGSHKLGRIDHGKTGGQTGADMERVDAALERLELVHCEIEPGTGDLLPREPIAPLRSEHQPESRGGHSSAATTPATTIRTRNRNTRGIHTWNRGPTRRSKKSAKTNWRN